MKPIYLALSLAYAAGIFWLSSRPVPIDPRWMFPGEDKLVHMAMYGGLAYLIAQGMRRAKRPASPMVLLIVPLIITAAYGASDEIHQIFVPGRTCDLLDWIADITGAACCTGFLHWRGQYTLGHKVILDQ